MPPAHRVHCPVGVPDALQSPRAAPSPQNHLPSATGEGRSGAGVSVLWNQQRKALQADFSSCSDRKGAQGGKSGHVRAQTLGDCFTEQRRQSQIPCSAAPEQPHCTPQPEKAAKGISLWVILEEKGPSRCLICIQIQVFRFQRQQLQVSSTASARQLEEL